MKRNSWAVTRPAKLYSTTGLAQAARMKFNQIPAERQSESAENAIGAHALESLRGALQSICPLHRSDSMEKCVPASSVEAEFAHVC